MKYLSISQLVQQITVIESTLKRWNNVVMLHGCVERHSGSWMLVQSLQELIVARSQVELVQVLCPVMLYLEVLLLLRVPIDCFDPAVEKAS